MHPDYGRGFTTSNMLGGCTVHCTIQQYSTWHDCYLLSVLRTGSSVDDKCEED